MGHSLSSYASHILDNKAVKAIDSGQNGPQSSLFNNGDLQSSSSDYDGNSEASAACQECYRKKVIPPCNLHIPRTQERKSSLHPLTDACQEEG